MDRYFNIDVIGIIEADADCKIKRVNPGICGMLGYSAEELILQDWMDIVDPEDMQKKKDYFGQLNEPKHDSVALEVRYRTKSGQRRDVAINVRVDERNVEGSPLNYTGFVVDISRQTQAQTGFLAANRRIDNLHSKIGRALGDVLRSRDPYTSDHQNHVARLADHISVVLGLPSAERRIVVAAACVHDIGKAAIPTEYLTKTAKLDELEWAVIRSHARHGFEILRPMEADFPVAEIVYQHHERLDGSGYPRGLCNVAVLREAQIIAAADIADSMMNSRPYRRKLGKDSAIAALTDERGSKLHEDVVDACIVVLDDLH